MTASSSKTIISGVPSPITFFADLVENMQEYLEEAVNEALDDEVAVSRKSLVMREPKYKDLVKDFDISYRVKDQVFNYGVGGESNSAAVALEYGVPGETNPKALIRHEAQVGPKRLSKGINMRLDKRTNTGVFL